MTRLSLHDGEALKNINDAGGKTIAVYDKDGNQLFVNLYGMDQIGKFTRGSAAQKYFYLKDHLGNIRVTINGSGAVKGYDDYYPFGLQMPERNNNTSNPNANYKYSGKELDEESLGPNHNLDWYHFGARNYDPEICRFPTVDRFTGKYPSLSPYQYAANNPINFIDVNGDSLILIGEQSAIDQATQLANASLGGFYTVSTDANGLVTVTTTGKEGKMTSEQKAFYNTLMGAASLDVGNVTIGIVQNEPVVPGDLYDYNQIDIGDMSNLGDLSAAMLGHSIAEQTEKQLNNLGNTNADYNRAHSVGLSAEANIYGLSRNSENTQVQIMRYENIGGLNFPVYKGFLEFNYSNGTTKRILINNGNFTGVK